MLLIAPALIGIGGAAAQGVVVYKHVDEKGRVTYANQPMKGATVVELSPLMVLPKSQTAAIAVRLPSTSAETIDVWGSSSEAAQIVRAH